MSQRICSRCAERREEAVKKLVYAAKSCDSAANLARAEAISTLRHLGYSTKQVVKARALALDGYPVERVLEVLAGEGEAVAA